MLSNIDAQLTWHLVTTKTVAQTIKMISWKKPLPPGYKFFIIIWRWSLRTTLYWFLVTFSSKGPGWPKPRWQHLHTVGVNGSGLSINLSCLSKSHYITCCHFNTASMFLRCVSCSFNSCFLHADMLFVMLLFQVCLRCSYWSIHYHIWHRKQLNPHSWELSQLISLLQPSWVVICYYPLLFVFI